MKLDPGCEHVTQLAPSVAPQSPVHDGGTTSSHHGPDPPFGVQQGQLQARPTFGIQVCNVSFLGIRQQQVGPVGIPFTKVPDLRTPPLPFPSLETHEEVLICLNRARKKGLCGALHAWDKT